MLFTPGKSKDRFRFVMSSRRLLVPVLLAALASVASGQQILPPTPISPACADSPEATYPNTGDAYTYPMTSNQYAVQYLLDGVWTNAQVYISYYGETDASPYRSDSGYLNPYTVGQTSQTSMSFVSIPAVGANRAVSLRVTLLSGGPFLKSDQVSVRPSVSPIVAVLTDGIEEFLMISRDKIVRWRRQAYHKRWRAGSKRRN
jgi:hypothetical protein